MTSLDAVDVSPMLPPALPPTSSLPTAAEPDTKSCFSWLAQELVDEILSFVASSGTSKYLYSAALISTRFSHTATTLLYRSITISTQLQGERLAAGPALGRHETMRLVIGRKGGVSIEWNYWAFTIMAECSGTLEELELGGALYLVPPLVFTRIPFPCLQTLVIACGFHPKAPINALPAPPPAPLPQNPLQTLELRSVFHRSTREAITHLLSLTDPVSTISTLRLTPSYDLIFTVLAPVRTSLRVVELYFPRDVLLFSSAIIEFLASLTCPALELRLEWSQPLMGEHIGQIIGAVEGNLEILVLVSDVISEDVVGALLSLLVGEGRERFGCINKLRFLGISRSGLEGVLFGNSLIGALEARSTRLCFSGDPATS